MAALPYLRRAPRQPVEKFSVEKVELKIREKVKIIAELTTTVVTGITRRHSRPLLLQLWRREEETRKMRLTW